MKRIEFYLKIVPLIVAFAVITVGCNKNVKEKEENVDEEQMLEVPCHNDEENEEVVVTTCCICHSDVIINADEYENAPNDPVYINEIIIDRTCLKITYSASGCSGNSWKVKLIGIGNYDKSNPPQTTLRLSLDNKEECREIITKEVSISLEPIMDLMVYVYETNQLYLNISGKGILFEF